MREIKIFAYTMTHDTGFAPAIHEKTLSLGCCKTFLRYKIAKEWNVHKDTTDFYIMGICGKQLADRNGIDDSYFPVYIAKVKEAVKTIDYYKDQLDPTRTDTQYSFRDGQWLYSKNNPHHTNTNGKLKDKDWRILPTPLNEKDIMYINRGKRDDNYILLSEEYMCPRSPELCKDPCIIAICDERKRAWRSDLSPIKSLDNPGLSHQFLDFFEHHKNDPEYNKATIDEYFIKKICKGECRHR